MSDGGSPFRMYPSSARPRRAGRAIVLAIALATAFAGMPAPALAQSDPGYAAGLPALGDPAQGSFSPSQERQMGRVIMRALRKEPDYLHDSLLRQYLQGIVNRLAPAARRTAEIEAPQTFRVFLLRDSTFNAFALPGGWIGVHTGLVVDAQAQAQLAAVFAHEMSHITQRHIAQRLAQAGKGKLIGIGSLILAVLAASTGQDQAAQGLIMGGQAAAIDNALRFSRSNERDADRTGTEVLSNSGYPPQAMASMLERLQNLSRLDDSNVFAFLQDHPLTSERIADAEARGGDKPLPPDHTLLFWLMNARARALSPATHDAMHQELAELSKRSAGFPAQEAAWAYGAAVLDQRLGDLTAAGKALARADAAAQSFSAQQRLPLDLLRVDLQLHGDLAAALATAQTLHKDFPESTAALHLLADCLLAQRDARPAREFLRQQTIMHPDDDTLWEDLARAHAALGEHAAQHRATAEAYALQGNLSGAIEQLHIAQRTPGAGYIEASIIDARLQTFEREQALDKQIDKTLPQ